MRNSYDGKKKIYLLGGKGTRSKKTKLQTKITERVEIQPKIYLV